MQIEEFLSEDLINLDFNPVNKEDALSKMVQMFKKENKIKSETDFLNKIFKREKEGSTGFGRQIAVPHGKSKTVKELSLAVARVKNGLKYNSLDGQKVKLIFMVADYEGYSPQYLKLVSTLVSLLRDNNFRTKLIEAKNKNEFIDLFRKKEKNK
ncbi:MAG: PTS sugar transporter subunit IIA [Bacillota bacterium]